LELAGAHRDALPLGCAYLELTGFGRMVELHGPSKALTTLGVLGRCMRRRLRRADIVGRLDAERFLVLLPETGAVEATALAKRLYEEFAVAMGSRPEGLDLRIVVLSYDLAPATLDELVRDVTALVARTGSTRTVVLRSTTRR
jgi:GGDEF domain-containing protein